MKYKIGDKVRIKSIDWHNENKDEYGNIDCGTMPFMSHMTKFCNKIVTISDIDSEDECYEIEEDGTANGWTDEMIEGLAEEETKPIFKIGDKITNGKDKLLILNIVSDKYIVEDNLGECGTVYFNNQDYWKLVEEENNKEDISWMYHGKLVAERFSDGANIKQPKYNKISINTEFCDNKVELAISPDFELKQEGDKWFAVKKKKEYPKTYKECCEILGFDEFLYSNTPVNFWYKWKLFHTLNTLIICRDAYWKLAGDEMGLGKPWEPNLIHGIAYTIQNNRNEIGKSYSAYGNKVLMFPTAEMRDAFYENFKKEIEICKELL